MSNIVNHASLRTILRLDAVTCAMVAALQLAFPRQLSPWLGLAAPLLLGSALYLLFYVGLLLSMAQAPRIKTWLLHLVVWGNVGWGLGCLALSFGLPGTTALGVAYLLMQALTVFVIAAWQWRAGRQGHVQGEAMQHA